jgi:hypothetical protein
VLHVLAGPLRVDVRGDSLTTAADVTTEPITLALHAARGWVFATERGDMYRSDTFTGRLQPLRALRCDAPMASSPLAVESHRRVVVTSPEGRALLWSDGDALHALDVPGAVAMAWQNEARGAVIVGYAVLKTTRDGGRSWRDVALGGALPLGLAGRADGLYVETSEGTRRVEADDALTPAELARTAIAPSLSAVEQVYLRGYERAPAPSQECAHAPERGTVNDWSPPHIIAHLPTRRSEGVDWPSAPAGSPSPFGTLHGRAFADARNVPAVVSITRPDDPVAGHPVTLAWRGEDERGPFTMRVQTRAPVALTFLALDGAEEPYGVWSIANVPAVCGARDAMAARLHLLHGDDEGDGHAAFSATIGPQFDGPEYASDRLATFERGARGATCVRRVWGVRQIGDAQDADGSYVDDLWGAFRLTARGGRLVAVSDDGRTVATFPMPLSVDRGFSEDL